jgi:hypothetical protein
MTSSIFSYFFGSRQDSIASIDSEKNIILKVDSQISFEENIEKTPDSSRPPLTGRVFHIESRDLLKVLLLSVKKSPECSQELLKILNEALEENPVNAKEIQEAISLLKTDIPESVGEPDSIEKEWLEDCVILNKDDGDQLPLAITSQSNWTKYAWATGGAVWYAAKTSGYVLYFVCDKLILSRKILQIASIAGGAASLIGLTGQPCLSVLQIIATFMLRKMIS